MVGWLSEIGIGTHSLSRWFKSIPNLTNQKIMNKSEWSLNINEFEIGQVVLDQDGTKCKVTNKSTNSIEVFIQAKKTYPNTSFLHTYSTAWCTCSKGVDATQWFEMRTFIKRFK